jgi:hypothetical protein
MTRSTFSNSYNGPSIVGLLGVLFIGLKLTGHIGWPWVWVLAPFWIPAAIAISVLLALAVVVAITDKN